MGDAKVNGRRGTFQLDNCAAADIGADFFLVDDETVTKTDVGGARSKAGVVLDIECGKVWIEI
ncbi:hypothetical protein AB1A64_10170 [Ruegeria sp. ANG10]|uniref:hypothetical protein n=1 Tax=Ruegeria sp. ANG10 TaxID=3042467 RepID=UPI0034549AA5